MLIIGLTGGVASGKNFVAHQFEKLRFPVFDADLEVHKLLAGNQEIFKKIQVNFPQTIRNNQIDRKLLGAEVFNNLEKLDILEAIIYPELHKQEQKFIKECRYSRQKIVILNIPLLFEKSGNKRCHHTISITLPTRTQFHRFKQRYQKQHGQDKEQVINQKFKQIISRQMTNHQRKRQADLIIHSGLSKAFTTRQVYKIAKSLINQYPKTIKKLQLNRLYSIKAAAIVN